MKTVRFIEFGPDRSYIKSIRQHQTSGTIIRNNVGLTYRTMVDIAIGWSEIVEIPM